MTNVIVNAIDVLGQEIDEGVVKISAADIQYTGGSLMLPEYHEQELVAGSTTITGVTPGKVVISIHWGVNRTATFRVFIPDTDEITLADLSLQKYDADPAIVSQVTDAALRAEGAAVRAEDVAEDFGSLEGVMDQVQAASDSALSASGSASAAASSASAAATSESNAADSASSAGGFASSAASSASSAAGSASAAIDAADAAAGSETAAASSASAAVSAASAANNAATRAETVADSTHWQDDRLSVMGQLGPSLKGPPGDKGEPGDGSGDVLWSEIDPVLAVKADLVGGKVPASQLPAVDLGPGDVGAAPVVHTHTVEQITDLPEIRSSAVPDSLTLRTPTGNVLVAETPSGPSSATSQAYVESFVASQLGQIGPPIVPVEALPANPDPMTFYAVVGPGAVPEPAAMATYQLVGSPTAGQDFPGTAVPSTFGFESNPGGWYAGASHGLTPPVAGTYTIKVTADPANGPVTIYPYVNGGWGTSITGTGATATATLQLTTNDAVYYDVVPTVGGVPVTITVKAFAGAV